MTQSLTVSVSGDFVSVCMCHSGMEGQERGGKRKNERGTEGEEEEEKREFDN